jgi:hypothetical protein
MKTVVPRNLPVVLSVFLGSFLVSIVTIALFLKAPRAVTYLFSPSAKRECGAIRPGKSRAQVLDETDHPFPPAFERVDQTEFEFVRDESGTCKVEFDPSTDIVSSAHFELSKLPQWDMRGID